MEYIKAIFAFFSGILAATIIEYLKIKLSFRRKNKMFRDEVKNEIFYIKSNINAHEKILFNNLYYGSQDGYIEKDKNGGFAISTIPKKVALYFLDRNIEELFVTATKNKQNILKALYGCLEQLEMDRKNLIEDIDEKDVLLRENRAKRIINMYNYMYSESIVLHILECFLSDKEVSLMPEHGPKYMKKVCEEHNICHEKLTLAKDTSKGWLKK
ncbi:hypothetical protein [Zymobacter sp. IVIA_5232.4 C2]|uniref:hypothetical protein n=1 Tax=Zymobacter sp. IVIA_5232.4 C2 TaxID=3394855 RepID=UPI0039C0AD50